MSSCHGRLPQQQFLRCARIAENRRNPSFYEHYQSILHMNETSLIVFLVGVLLLAAGCAIAFRREKDNANSEFDYEKKVRQQLEDYDRRGKRTDDQLDEADERGRRVDLLLTKWEEHARRHDAILEHLEKQHQIQKGHNAEPGSAATQPQAPVATEIATQKAGSS
jgi:hypothetical protein